MGQRQSLVAAISNGDVASVRQILLRSPSLVNENCILPYKTPALVACQPDHSGWAAGGGVSETARCAIVKLFAEAARAAVQPHPRGDRHRKGRSGKVAHSPPGSPTGRGAAASASGIPTQPLRSGESATAAEAAGGGGGGSETEAGRRDDAEAARAVRAMLNACSSEGVTPLMLACQCGFAALTSVLLSLGADPWQQDGVHGRAAIHLAALYGRDKCVAALLLHHEAEEAAAGRQAGQPEHGRRRMVDVATRHGCTPLFFAVASGSRSTVRALLTHRPSLAAATTTQCHDLGMPLRGGTSALHLAALRPDRYAVIADILTYHLAATLPAGGAAPVAQSASTAPRPSPSPPTTPSTAAAAPLRISEIAAAASPPPSPFAAPQLPSSSAAPSSLLPDPRLLRDVSGQTPASIAARRGHASVAALLHPTTNLAAALALARPGAARHGQGDTAAADAADTALRARLLAGLAAIAAAAAASTAAASTVGAGAASAFGGGPPSTQSSGRLSGHYGGAANFADDGGSCDDGGGGDGCCGVCLDLAEGVEVVDCGHRLCPACAVQLVSRRWANAAPRCPFCRHDMSAFRALDAPPAAAAVVGLEAAVAAMLPLLRLASPPAPAMRVRVEVAPPLLDALPPGGWVRAAGGAGVLA